MKNIILPALIIALVIAACNTKTNDSTSGTKSEQSTPTDELFACPMHPEIIGKEGEKCSKCGMELTVPVKKTEITPQQQGGDTLVEVNRQQAESKVNNESVPSRFSIDDIVNNYLTLKNALTKDDTNGAAKAGKAIETAFKNADLSGLSAAQKISFTDIAMDAREHSEHIGDNAGKLEHQREHFVMLSKDINDLIKSYGAGQKLYQDFCPMYDDGKGAIWLSETKDIKNPYYGSKMLGCGSMQKEY
jgi:hypothetical protein